MAVQLTTIQTETQNRARQQLPTGVPRKAAARLDHSETQCHAMPFNAMQRNVSHPKDTLLWPRTSLSPSLSILAVHATVNMHMTFVFGR